MNKNLVVLVLAIIAANLAGYSEEFFRAITVGGLVMIYYNMPER